MLSREVRVDCINSLALQGKTIAGTKNYLDSWNAMHTDDLIFCFL